MLNRFKKFIAEKNLFLSENRILLAVSGGIDSVVMCELFHLSNFKFAIAHCNFQMRGKDSDSDEKFVKELAEKYKVKCFSKKFNTKKYAAEKKISVQMAARELRYEWFEKIRNENRLDYISIATQKNDEIETALLNFTRGTGISGLHGIFPKRGNIIRPLLFATRKEILEFAAEKKLRWREDKSNLSEHYLRNKIRHKIIPVLKEINPNLEQSFSETIEKIREAEEVFHQQIEDKKKEIFKNEHCIEIHKLLQLSPLKTYLFEFLKPYNFNETVVEKIISSLKKQSGKKFFSETHFIIKDRKYLLINADRVSNTVNIGEEIIYENTKRINSPLRLKFQIADKKDFKLIKDEKFAFLDYEKLKFPLVLRQWKSGDWFIPFGMKGKKKISDFLIDEKISLAEKEKIFVLVSFGKIIWVAGKRIDENFKVTEKTKKIFIAEKL